MPKLTADPRLPKKEPLRIMFVITSMPVGGAETLLVNLIRRLDRRCFLPQLCCLKDKGPLGEQLAADIAVHDGLLSGKYDLRVLPRLVGLLKREQIDVVITVGAGDKMFWGRLAAWISRVPVIVSALHSTGWPDGIGRLNKLLTRLTDAFIGVARPHARHLVENERFPEAKVWVIPNGVDTERFRPTADSNRLREELGLREDALAIGIVAALRPEKNHALFLQAAASVSHSFPQARFLIVGDGPERPRLQSLAADLKIASEVHFLGNREDVPAVLSLLDVFVLTSHNEANPVSILEAMSCERPVVATDVGSVRESVCDGRTGRLVPPGDRAALVDRILELLANPKLARALGQAGRVKVVQEWSLENMVLGYESLITELYSRKTAYQRRTSGTASATVAGRTPVRQTPRTQSSLHPH